ncbi:unnamed protein product, partial [Polarella glacialis]
IVHRDLKPENFLFQSKGVPLEHNTLKLIDFGLSKFLAEGEVLENLVGSAPYVAPEVVARSSGRPCDLWSCGAIMYMMLSGAPPFTGMNDRQVFQKAKSEKPRLIGRLWEPVSEAAKDLIRRLLDADPASRITAEHALESDWIKGESADKAALDPEIVRNLHRFSSASRFKRTALIAVAHQLREDEVETLRASFNAMDKDGDGCLTLDEMSRALAASLPDLVPLEDLKRVMDEIDVNDDGYVSYTEFLAAAMNQRLPDNEQLCWRAFKAFDLDGDGSISLSELRTVMGGDQEMTRQVSPDVASLFQELDSGGQGHVMFPDFMRVVSADSEREAAASQSGR